MPVAVFLAASFGLGLAVSWQRWGNPLVDYGREMNQPLRLLYGERLYSDIRHIYGPLSPYINFLLFHLFKPSLVVLYADGIVTAGLILALVYWLARQLMGRAPSAVATLGVMWMCVLKPAGNYILPYAYAAVHGCALGLAMLALAVQFSRTRRPETLFAAGVLAGLTMLAKTETGLAALITGIGAAALAGYPRLRRAAALGAVFALPALAIPLAVYAAIAARVGWHTLTHENFVFLLNAPPELLYFNERMFGFDQPLHSLLLMLDSLLRLGWLAALIAGLSYWLASRERRASSALISGADADSVRFPRRWWLLTVLLTGIVVPSAAMQKQPDTGPFLAMPILLVAVLGWAMIRYWRHEREGGETDAQTRMLIVTATYALASLARMLLRVRSGGAYGSYALPASVILFVYIGVSWFADGFEDAHVRRFARQVTLGLLFISVATLAVTLAYRYHTDRTVFPITTPRGKMLTYPELGQAFTEAMHLIEQKSSPHDPVAVMPEGTSLLFFTDRRNPLREEITTPGYLDSAAEERAIQQLSESNTRLVLVTNRPTEEFGATVFGRDYNRRLMGWVEAKFVPCGMLGVDHRPDLEIGSKTFFIRAYCKK
jgi:hypothetical protein